LESADAVVAPTSAMLKELRRHYGWGGAGNVVYNGKSATAYTSSDKENFIFVAGRLWDEAKNIAALEQIGPDLSWPIYAAGHNELSGKGHKCDGINMLGHLNADEIARWFGCASIYALPARYEPFGLSVLEAALSRCALVLGDIPSLREIWNDVAFFAPPDDTQQIKALIQRLVDNPELRKISADRAYQRASELTPSRMASGYLAVYQHLLGHVHIEPSCEL
jgi:glycosyltransferase involved in cell wall biosynthesis